MRRRLLLSLTVVGALAGLLGCEPAPPPVRQPPVPARVALGGDSLAWTAGLWNGYYPGFDTERKMYMGWQAEDIQPRVTQDVANPLTSMDVLIIALGHNDAANGLDDLDRSQLFSLAMAPTGACTVLVKPYYPGPNAARVAGIQQYRDWVDEMQRALPQRIGVVDWAPIAVTTTGFAADGFHFIEGQPASTAYYDMLMHAPEACPNHSSL